MSCAVQTTTCCVGGENVDSESATSIWKSIVAPASPAIVMGLFGFWIVHQLSLRRQRRSEWFEARETVKSAVHSLSDKATATWLLGGNDPAATKAIIELKTGFRRLGIELELLKRREPSLDVADTLIAFRQASTDDIEDSSRSINVDRAVAVQATEAALLQEFDDLFFQVIEVAPWERRKARLGG